MDYKTYERRKRRQELWIIIAIAIFAAGAVALLCWFKR